MYANASPMTVYAIFVQPIESTGFRNICNQSSYLIHLLLPFGMHDEHDAVINIFIECPVASVDNSSVTFFAFCFSISNFAQSFSFLAFEIFPSLCRLCKNNGTHTHTRSNSANFCVSKICVCSTGRSNCTGGKFYWGVERHFYSLQNSPAIANKLNFND